MASQKSKRRSRKRRNPAAAPHAVPSQRREVRAERRVTAERNRARRDRPTGTYGERPPSPFAGLPVSEVAIFAGGVGFVIGLIQGGGWALIVGAVVCGLGVLEVTAREHFTGYRSHAALLAAFPAVGLETAIVFTVGVPRQRSVLLLVVVPVYGAVFWLLRRRFQTARQARIARPPQA